MERWCVGVGVPDGAWEWRICGHQIEVACMIYTVSVYLEERLGGWEGHLKTSENSNVTCFFWWWKGRGGGWNRGDRVKCPLPEQGWWLRVEPHPMDLDVGRGEACRDREGKESRYII